MHKEGGLLVALTSGWCRKRNRMATPKFLSEPLKVAAQRGYVDDLKLAVSPLNVNAVDELGNTLLRKCNGLAVSFHHVTSFLITDSQGPLFLPSDDQTSHALLATLASWSCCCNLKSPSNRCK